MTRETRLEWLRLAEISAERERKRRPAPRHPGIRRKTFSDPVEHLSAIILQELNTVS